MNLEQYIFQYNQTPQVPRVKQEGSALRCSQLGKPAVLQALYKLGYVETYSQRTEATFAQGHLMEEWLIGKLNESFLIRGQQEPIEYHGVAGHIDCIIDNNGVDTLIEIKTMSEAYFKRFTEYPNDDRGYITQLSVYTESLGLPGAWLCFNKNTSELALIPLVDELRTPALHRVHQIIPLLQEVETEEDVYELFSPPPGRKEVYKKEETGRLLLPLSMAYSVYMDCFYEVVVDENFYGKTANYIFNLRSKEDGCNILRRVRLG